MWLAATPVQKEMGWLQFSSPPTLNRKDGEQCFEIRGQRTPERHFKESRGKKRHRHEKRGAFARIVALLTKSDASGIPQGQHLQILHEMNLLRKLKFCNFPMLFKAALQCTFILLGSDWHLHLYHFAYDKEWEGKASKQPLSLIGWLY